MKSSRSFEMPRGCLANGRFRDSAMGVPRPREAVTSRTRAPKYLDLASTRRVDAGCVLRGERGGEMPRCHQSMVTETRGRTELRARLSRIDEAPDRRNGIPTVRIRGRNGGTPVATSGCSAALEGNQPKTDVPSTRVTPPEVYRPRRPAAMARSWHASNLAHRRR